jgi:hypothetical protein
MTAAHAAAGGSTSMNRRAFFGTAAAAAGAVAAAPLLAGCGQSGGSGTGTTSASQIERSCRATCRAT